MKLSVSQFKDKLISYLYSITGKDLRTANNEDMYMAISYLLREIIGMNWEDSKIKYNNLKTVYILSFEYLPGKMLEKNLLYLGLRDIAESVLGELDFKLEDILDIETELGIGHGSLGAICDSYLDSLSTMQFPGFAYGIRYERGLMIQKLVDGIQIEEPDNWLKKTNVWELKKYYNYDIEYKDFQVKAQSFDFPYIGYDNKSVNTMRLWSAEPKNDLKFDSFSKGNLQEAYDEYIKSKSISEFLYPDDSTRKGKRFRLMQEYFYVSASIKDIIRRYFKYKGNILKLGDRICIEINDVHPILAIPELINILTVDYGLSYEMSFKISSKLFTYTNHTTLSESFELWDISLIEDVIPQLVKPIRYLDELSRKEFKEMGISDDEVFEMAIIQNSHLNSVNLASFVSRTINSLSDMHQYVLSKENLRGYYKYYKDKFIVKRGSINHRRWLLKSNKKLTDLISQTIGDDFKRDSNKMIELLEYKNDGILLDELGRIKYENKREVAEYLKKELGIKINPYSVFDMQLSRFHEYKRQLLNAFKIASDYFLLKENCNYDIVPRTYFFGGKAPSSYYIAKEIIAFINSLMKVINNDRLIKDKIKIVFIENLNISKTEFAIKAADVNESLATASKESASMSTLKFMMNGAITIGVSDGLNKEIFSDLGRGNYFEFGISSEEVMENDRGGYNAYEYYNQSPEIRNLINRLNNKSMTEFQYNFKPIYNMLIKYNDSFMVLRDFLSYKKAQERLEKRYRDEVGWNEMALINIAKSGKYSSDTTMLEFADMVWRINNENI
ncbi:MAG: glycogen/starch/alpha-glucan family phosphorylase [Tissierellia bacterium]|nr:glycogen/starch/alpha-glucan family phosphorylase [Tissierellia bacterium]